MRTRVLALMLEPVGTGCCQHRAGHGLFPAPDSHTDLGGLAFLEANLTSKGQGEEGMEYIDLFHIFVTRSPASFRSGSTFLPLASDVPTEALLVALQVPYQIQLQMGFLSPIPACSDSVSALDLSPPGSSVPSSTSCMVFFLYLNP